MKTKGRYWVALRVELVARDREVAFVRQEVARADTEADLRRAVESRVHGVGDFVLEERGGGFTHSRSELHVETERDVSTATVDAYRRLAVRRVEEAKAEPVEEIFQPPQRVVPAPQALAPSFAMIDPVAAVSVAPSPEPAPPAPETPVTTAADPSEATPEAYARLAREVRDAYALYDEALRRLAARDLPEDYLARLGEAIRLAAGSAELVPSDPPAPPPAIVPARAEPTSSEVVTPRLQRRLGPRRPLVIVGGTPVPEMVQRLRKWLGMAPEWITCDKGQDRTTMPLAERISQGNVAAVLLVEQLLSHTNANRIKLAAMASATPFAYVNKGGVEGVRRGLRTIEATLEKRAG